jgi:sarcosine oxidase gamma subunit
MAFAIIHHFPGGTRENYEASIGAVHPAPGQLPAGQIYHAAGASPDGWTIVAVHDSKQSWEQFRDEILMPRMQAGIEGGFPTPPQETEIDVESILP